MEGDFKEPLTLHAYLYCQDDPINRTDPSGKFSLADTLSVAANWGSMGYQAYGIASRVLGYAQRLVEGANLRSVLLNAAADMALDYATGKAFGILLKGAGRVGTRLVKAGHDHHWLSTFAGGLRGGRRTTLDVVDHIGKGNKSWHNILIKHLKKRFGEKAPKYINRNKEAWLELLHDSTNKMRFSEALVDATGEFDEICKGKYNAVDNVVKTLIEQWYPRPGNL